MVPTDKHPTRTAEERGQDPVLAALAALGPAAATEIAGHTGLGYSTVTTRLRKLATTGAVRKQPAGSGATTWRPAGPAAEPDNQPEPVTPTGTDEPTSRPGTSRARAKADRSGRAGDPAASAEKRSASGGGPGGTVRRRDDRPGATTPAGADGAAGGKPRRGHGQLREQVLDLMQTHPDDTWTVTRLSKALDGASPGAIVLAARKLVADGNAKEVLARPATFQAE